MTKRWYVIVELFNALGHVNNMSIENFTADDAREEWMKGKLTWGPYYTRAAAAFVESNSFNYPDYPGEEGQLHVGNLPVKKTELQDDDISYAAKLAATIARGKSTHTYERLNYLIRLISKIGQSGVEKELERLYVLSIYQKPRPKPGRAQKVVLEDTPENFALRFMDFLGDEEHSGWSWPSSSEPSTFWEDRISWAKVFLPVVELLSLQYEGKALLDMLGFVNWNLMYFARFPQEATKEENQDIILGYSY